MAISSEAKPAFYTVVQYVPDPVADDRVSVGVIVFGDGQLRSRFLQNWNTVRSLAGEDIGFLRDFAARVDEAAITSAGQPSMTDMFDPALRSGLDESRLINMIGEWSNSIQFTHAEPSLQAHDDLLTTVAEIFLREPERRSHQFRDRQQAAQLAIRAVRSAVDMRVGERVTKKAVQSRYPVAGRWVRNVKVDLAIKNGRVYEVAQALSFEIQNMGELDVQATSVIYSLGDIREQNQQIQVSAFVLPPKPSLRNFDQSRQRFNDFQASLQRIGARMVLEEQVDEWAGEIAALVQREIA